MPSRLSLNSAMKPSSLRIRAISRFLRQIRVPYSQDYMWTTLTKHAALAAQVVGVADADSDEFQGCLLRNWLQGKPPNCLPQGFFA